MPSKKRSLVESEKKESTTATEQIFPDLTLEDEDPANEKDGEASEDDENNNNENEGNEEFIKFFNKDGEEEDEDLDEDYEQGEESDNDDFDDDDEDDDDISNENEEAIRDVLDQFLKSKDSNDLIPAFPSTTNKSTIKAKSEESKSKAISKFAVDDSSSDEEWHNPNQNTVGDIPMEYYNDHDIIGYNLEGKPIAKPPKKDAIDQFLQREDNPDFYRTVFDKANQKEVVLSREEYSIIKSLIKQQYLPTFDPFQEFYEYDNPEDKIHPAATIPPRKGSFLPSRWEAKKIRKLVKAIRRGLLKVGEKEEKPEWKPYEMWKENEKTRQKRFLLQAPKPKLPGHAESYNPPPEYLGDNESIKVYERLIDVPSYQGFVRDRFERCLDLFLAPRIKGRKKMNIDPDSLIPKLPSPQQLKPFPSMESVIYKGHTGKVRSISIHPSGQFMISGSDDKTVRLWEVETGRCLKVFQVGATVFSVSFNPDPSRAIFAIAAGTTVWIMFSEIGGKEIEEATEALFEQEPDSKQSNAHSLFQWSKVEEESQRKFGARYKITHEVNVKQIVWHGRGDYLAAVSAEGNQKNVLFIHQISSRKTQSPFRKLKDKQVQSVAFHPKEPQLYVATKTHVRVFDLRRLKLVKKLSPGVSWISSIEIHPGGDNVLLGSYDKKVCWFDLDFSTKPFKTLKYHKMAVRKVCYSPRYPLFASCSDDLGVAVFHSTVYNDYSKNALIVPLKFLRAHQTTDDLGVLDCAFHPLQPWLFSAGADTTIRLWT